jgi:hypothetical protein
MSNLEMCVDISIHTQHTLCHLFVFWLLVLLRIEFIIRPIIQEQEYKEIRIIVREEISTLLHKKYIKMSVQYIMVKLLQKA